jgi:peptidoglycan/LPS O-acetylase OafA/YrhL
MPFAWILLSPKELQQFSQSILALSIFISNIFFANNSGYFDGDANTKPLLHTWSLSVEE